MDFFISGLVKNYQPNDKNTPARSQSKPTSNNNSKLSQRSISNKHSQPSISSNRQVNLPSQQKTSQNQHNQNQSQKSFDNKFQDIGLQIQDVEQEVEVEAPADEQEQSMLQRNLQKYEYSESKQNYSSNLKKQQFSYQRANHHIKNQSNSDDQNQDMIGNYLPKVEPIKQQSNQKVDQKNIKQVQHEQAYDNIQSAKLMQSKQFYFGSNKSINQAHNRDDQESHTPMILSNTRNSLFFPQLKKNYEKPLSQIIKSLNTMRYEHKQFYQMFKNERYQFQQLLIFFQDQMVKQLNFYIQRDQANKKDKKEFMVKDNSRGEDLQRKQRQYQMQKKLILEEHQQKINYLKQKNNNLETQLREIKEGQDRQFKEIQRRKQQTNQPQNSEQKTIKKVQTSDSQSKNDEINQLHYYINQLKQEMHQKDMILQQIQKQNQNLSEHIFDIEQQVAGIQLQVQKKLQEQLFKLRKSGLINITNQNQNSDQRQNYAEIHDQRKLNTITEESQLQQSMSNNPTNLINSHNVSASYQKFDSQKIQQLTKQLESAIKKCQFLQLERKNKQNVYQERERIIKIKQTQLQKNEEDINYQWSQLDKEIHRNKVRQNQLQLAQENISKKISELRLKETQLIEKQRELQAKIINFQRQKSVSQKNISQKMEQLDRRNSNNFDHSSLNGTNQIKSPLTYDNNKQQIYIPELPIRGSKNEPERDYETRYSQIDGNSISMKYRPDKIYDTQQNRNSNLQRDANYQPDKFYRQRQRQSYQTASNFRPNRKNIAHQYVLPQSPNKRSRSKSRSHQKNIGKNLYGSHLQGQAMTNYKMVGNYKQQIKDPQNGSYSSTFAKGGNISGLGSKLQRLRNQIKKQIESIK